MTERDRLAALLHRDRYGYAIDRCEADPVLASEHSHSQLLAEADRLIAAGVGMADMMPRVTDIDVERLARALDRLFEERWGKPPYAGQTTLNLENAAAIAAAYREDAG